jgi:hypothetical protein
MQFHDWAELVWNFGAALGAEVSLANFRKDIYLEVYEEVRGAGPGFDGLCYVKSVTHMIKRGEYKQDFKLSRNGLVSTVQTVTP